MITRRKFLAMLSALPAIGCGLGSVSAPQFWWLPKSTRDWIAGAGQQPHWFNGGLVTTDVDYWRLSVWQRSRKIDQQVRTQIMDAARA